MESARLAEQVVPMAGSDVDAVAIDEVDEGSDVARGDFEIDVDVSRDATRGGLEAGLERGAPTAVAFVEDVPAIRCTLADVLEDLPRIVFAAVVDEDQFVPISGEVQRLDQLCHALSKVRSLVVARNDQREIRRHDVIPIARCWKGTARTSRASLGRGVP